MQHIGLKDDLIISRSLILISGILVGLLFIICYFLSRSLIFIAGFITFVLLAIIDKFVANRGLHGIRIIVFVGCSILFISVVIHMLREIIAEVWP